MIAIRPASRERVEELCRDNAFPREGKEFACQAAADQWVLFRLDEGACTILEAVCDPFLLDGLVRSALNLADLRGVDRYTFGGRMVAHWGEKLQALGYPAGEGSISALFSGGCACPG